MDHRTGRNGYSCFNCGLTGQMSRYCSYPKPNRKGREAQGRSKLSVAQVGFAELEEVPQDRIHDLRRQFHEEGCAGCRHYYPQCDFTNGQAGADSTYPNWKSMRLRPTLSYTLVTSDTGSLQEGWVEVEAHLQVIYLGHVVSAVGVTTQSMNLEAVATFQHQWMSRVLTPSWDCLKATIISGYKF